MFSPLDLPNPYDDDLYDDDRLAEYDELDHEDRADREREANERSERNDTGGSYYDDDDQGEGDNG